MNGYDLERVMRADPHTSPIFEGVFAADTLPRFLSKRPALLIFNVDRITQKGSHWQAAHIDKDGNGQFFDSYGMSPFVPAHKRFMDRVCKTWTHNPIQLQALDSAVCGHYCLLYLIFKAHGYSLEQMINMFFDDDVNKNDAVVEYLVDRYTENDVFCDDFIINRNPQTCAPKRK